MSDKTVTGTEEDAPLDLSLIGAEEHPVVPATPPAGTAALQPLPAAKRLVEVGKLLPEDLAEAQARAAQVDFRAALTLLNHGAGAQGELAAVSRRLLEDRTVAQAGEVGDIASAVLDGIKVLRLEDIQRENVGGAPIKKGGLLSRVIGLGRDVHSAIQGFEENRKQFLSLMDGQSARARRTLSDLKVKVGLLEQMGDAARRGIHSLKLDVAAAQIALDRGYGEEEALRQRALASGDEVDAAEVLSYRANLANFAGKASELRLALVKAAGLIPTIDNTRRSGEMRIMKISTGLMQVIPSLMTAAAAAVAQADIRAAAAEADRLAKADRQVMRLSSQGAHDVAVEAARSLGADQGTVAVLAQVVQQQVATLHELVTIDSEFVAKDRATEQSLVDIRDTLVAGMRSAQRQALSTPLQPGP